MPVQFPNTSLDQAHLDPGHLLGDRQLANSHLACPPAGFNAFVRITERVLERWLFTFPVCCAKPRPAVKARATEPFSRKLRRFRIPLLSSAVVILGRSSSFHLSMVDPFNLSMHKRFPEHAKRKSELPNIFVLTHYDVIISKKVTEF